MKNNLVYPEKSTPACNRKGFDQEKHTDKDDDTDRRERVCVILSVYALHVRCDSTPPFQSINNRDN